MKKYTQQQIDAALRNCHTFGYWNISKEEQAICDYFDN